MRLESWYVPARGGAGSMRLRLVNTSPDALAAFELTFTTVVQLDPVLPARLVGRRSGCHVVAPPDGFVLGPGETWDVTATCGHRPRHSNDGPASAYVTIGDEVRTVRTGETRRVVMGETAPVTYRADGAVAAAALEAVRGRDERLHPYRPPVLTTTGERTVAASIDAAMAQDAFRLVESAGGWSVAAGSTAGVERALTALVRAARSASPVPAGEHVAAHGWRGLHVDLARQFLPAADVEWLVDVAAWHGLNRLHLHLTDDEAWRFPVPGFERLTDIGAWRGRGLAVPPLLGSGARPYGGSYDRAAIAAWHVRAEAAGIVIVPEVDLPGHCFAALAALPDLLDPDDTSAAVSVQHFVDDVLNPGVPGTWPFLEAVFGALADAFPSPWLHLGGDEVAPGAWSGSPAARAWGIARGVDGSHAIEQTFLREVIGLVRRTTGRRIGVWEEAAGAVERDDGYVVAWTSGEVARRLAGEGHDVVAAPAQHCYLDMAASADWHEPGASWAGHTSVADIEAFDPAAGWSAAEREHLLGVQACLWTEHVRDRPTMERLLFPRLTAFADAAWPGPERRV